MAGSYNHVVKKTGELRKPQDVCSMLECMSGDVYEAVEEMYGMIWYLANGSLKADRDYPVPPDMLQEELAKVIEAARQKYKEGLALSPTKRFKK